MVLESIKPKWIEHRPYISFFFGVIYTFIGYFLATRFFPGYISIAMLFLSTLLIVPSLVKLLDIEERRERRYGLKHFFKEHRDIVEAYIFLFIGVFVGYLLLGFFVTGTQYNQVFEFQRGFLLGNGDVGPEVIGKFMETDFSPKPEYVLGIISNNLLVVIILFILSFFYGAGAIFLLVLNASVFASFIIYVIEYLARTLNVTLALIGVFCVHMLPEVSGFLLAAIAGGVVSKAMIREKITGKGFSNVIQDATLLLFAGVFLIVAAAFLEIYVTPFLFKMVA